RERRDGGARRMKQLAREAVPPGIAGTPDDGAESPERTAVTVFGAGRLEPLPAVREEVPEPPRRSIEGVIHKGEIAGGQRAYHQRIVAAGLFDERHQQQRSSVVVEAVAVVIPRNVEDRVLEDARIIGHRPNVPQVNLRPASRPARERLRSERAPAPAGLAG